MVIKILLSESLATPRRHLIGRHESGNLKFGEGDLDLLTVVLGKLRPAAPPVVGDRSARDAGGSGDRLCRQAG